MDNYCKANSSKNIAEGGEVLFDEIARHASSDKAGAPSPAAMPSTPNPQLAAPPPPAMLLPAPIKLTTEAMPSPTPVKMATEARSSPSPAKVTTESMPAKVAAETTAEPRTPQSAESPAAAVNASTYLPRALMLANTLPLGNSKYQFKAEQFAKANGCVRPAATMNIRTASSETFAVNCADGAALSVRCDPDCRDLQ
jgi:hypothetical protein